MTYRTLLAAVAAVIVAGCASTSQTGPEEASATALPEVIDHFHKSGLWFGKSDHSPFGPMPYALVAREVGGALVLRADVPQGLGLPDGAYQQFTITAERSHGSTLDFETSLTGEIVTGRMVERSRTRDFARYCMPEDEGGCQTMEVSFSRGPPGITFATTRDREPHHQVLLAPARL